jgi:hypothetical protein
MAAPGWLAALEPRAPDVVAVWETIDDEEPVIRAIAFRREIRRRAGRGSAARILAQHEAIADALASVLSDLPESLLRAPGGEGDWNVAQAFVQGYTARSVYRTRRAQALRSIGSSRQWPPSAASRRMWWRSVATFRTRDS